MYPLVFDPHLFLSLDAFYFSRVPSLNSKQLPGVNLGVRCKEERIQFLSQNNVIQDYFSLRKYSFVLMPNVRMNSLVISKLQVVCNIQMNSLLSSKLDFLFCIESSKIIIYCKCHQNSLLKWVVARRQVEKTESPLFQRIRFVTVIQRCFNQGNRMLKWKRLTQVLYIWRGF